jgi:hypothetical protein
VLHATAIFSAISNSYNNGRFPPTLILRIGKILPIAIRIPARNA